MADFDTWLVDDVLRRLPVAGGQLRPAIMRVLESLLSNAGMVVEEKNLQRLERHLFDRNARATGVFAMVRGPRRSLTPLGRLTAAGMSEPDVAIMPMLAFRLGAIHDRLGRQPAPGWDELAALAASILLSSYEKRAVEIARSLRPPRFAGAFLTEAVARAVETRQSTRDASRLAANALRAAGQPLATEAFFRTRIALVNCRAHFEIDRSSWTEDTLIHRMPSATPCRECLRLAYGPDGFPRLYRVSDLERGRSRWPNRGPRRRWKATIGPVHSNCVCSPWMRWFEELRPLAARRAPETAALLRRYGIVD